MRGVEPADTPPSKHPGNAWEVFLVFLRLGLTSFGGPVAHLGYFRDMFVERRRWLSEKAYADLVALCQFLPGPASSQVGMALGLQRAGYAGMFAAWFAFTMPSVALLVAFAYGVDAVGDLSDADWIQGFKAAAVAVVAHAVLGMARILAPDAPRATIAAVSMVVVLLLPTPFVLVGAIALAGLIGLVWLKPGIASSDSDDAFTVQVSRRMGAACVAVFAALLAGLPALAAFTNSTWTGIADLFYRAGALVFGGGHVVLPLLQAETADFIAPDTFLAGYGAAQAVPGPLFTFAGFLGTSSQQGAWGLLGAVMAVLFIFLPAALLTVGALPFWEALRKNSTARRALLGVNAGVVGVLAAAFYDPVLTVGVLEPGLPGLILAITAFVALNNWKAPAWAVVIGAGLAGWILT